MKNVDDEVSKVLKLSLLYDFYGELLKEHHKIIFEDYILNDLSLSEIANEQGISRQAIHDTVKRCSKQLIEYEEKLHLILKFNKTKELVCQMKSIAIDMKKSDDTNRIDEILKISNNILEEM